MPRRVESANMALSRFEPTSVELHRDPGPFEGSSTDSATAPQMAEVFTSGTSRARRPASFLRSVLIRDEAFGVAGPGAGIGLHGRPDGHGVGVGVGGVSRIRILPGSS